MKDTENKWVLEKGPAKKGYYYRNVYTDERSELFEHACDYVNGYGLVQLPNRNYAFRDMEGNLSEEYWYAYKYSNGFALVEKNNGKYAFRDMNGNLSEEYDYAESYSNGLAVVKKDNRKYAYRDMKGNLSEEYESARAYLCGDYGSFALVKNDSGEWFYRDMFGNLTNEAFPTSNAGAYFNDKIDAVDLDDKDIKAPGFVEYIINKTKNMTTQCIDLAENEEQLEKTKDYYLEIMENVLSRAYFLKQQAKELQQAQQEFNGKKKDLLDELGLNK